MSLFSNGTRTKTEGSSKETPISFGSNERSDPQALDKLRAYADEKNIELEFDSSFGNLSQDEKMGIAGRTLEVLRGLSPEQLESIRAKGGFQVRERYSRTALTELSKIKTSGEKPSKNVKPTHSPEQIKEAYARAERIRARKEASLQFNPPVIDNRDSNEEQNFPPEKEVRRENLVVIEGINVFFDKDLLGEEGKTLDTEKFEDIKAEVDGALQDLDKTEIEILISEGVTIMIKGEEVLTPVYEENAKVLRVGIYNTGEEVVNAIRNTIMPSLRFEPAIKNNPLNEANNTPEEQGIETREDVVPEPSEEVSLGEPEPNVVDVEVPGETLGEVAGNEEVIPEEQGINTNWREGEKWKNLEKVRVACISAEIAYMKDKSEENESKLNDIRGSYKWFKQEIANEITESLRLEIKDEAELRKETNRILFDELVVAENQIYLEAIRLERGQTITDKAKEVLRNSLVGRATKWYLGLDRGKRLACSFVLGGAIGLAVGAVSAPGAVGFASWTAWRVARFASSGVLTAEAKKAVDKIKTIEELNECEQKDTDALRDDPNLSIEDKTLALKDIQEYYRRRKTALRVLKFGTVVAVGAGTGLLSGLAEGAVMGHVNTAEQVGGNRGNTLQGDKLSSKSDFQPEPDKPIEPVTETVPKPVSAEVPSDIEKVLVNPEDAKHVPKSGDSLWGVTKETFKHTDQFNKFSGDAGVIEAKQTFATSSYLNEILKNPDKYGVGPNGEIYIGKQVDLSDIFSDKERFERVIQEAENLSPQKINSILGYNRQIEQFVDKNPEVRLDADKVKEILSEKPEIQVGIQERATYIPPPQTSPVVEEAVGILDKVEEIKVPEKTGVETIDSWRDEIAKLKTKAEALEDNKTSLSPEDLRKQSLEIQKQVNDLLDKIEKGVATEQKEMDQASMGEMVKDLTSPVSKGVAGAGIIYGGVRVADKLMDNNDLKAARERLRVLEEGKDAGASNSIRSMEGDRKILEESRNVPLAELVEQALIDDVDRVLGRKGLFSRKKGIDTPEWAFVKGLPFVDLDKFYGKNPREARLSSMDAAELTKTDKYVKLLKHINELLSFAEKDSVAVSVTPEDSVEDVLRRVGKYLLGNREVKALPNATELKQVT